MGFLPGHLWTPCLHVDLRNELYLETCSRRQDVPLDLRSEFLSAHLAESWERHLIGMAGVPYRFADMFDFSEITGDSSVMGIYSLLQALLTLSFLELFELYYNGGGSFSHASTIDAWRSQRGISYLALLSNKVLLDTWSWPTASKVILAITILSSWV